MYLCRHAQAFVVLAEKFLTLTFPNGVQLVVVNTPEVSALTMTTLAAKNFLLEVALWGQMHEVCVELTFPYDTANILVTVNPDSHACVISYSVPLVVRFNEPAHGFVVENFELLDQVYTCFYVYY